MAWNPGENLFKISSKRSISRHSGSPESVGLCSNLRVSRPVQRSGGRNSVHEKMQPTWLSRSCVLFGLLQEVGSKPWLPVREEKDLWGWNFGSLSVRLRLNWGVNELIYHTYFASNKGYIIVISHWFKDDMPVVNFEHHRFSSIHTSLKDITHPFTHSSFCSETHQPIPIGF